jgi:hypothetical protein
MPLSIAQSFERSAAGINETNGPVGISRSPVMAINLGLMSFVLIRVDYAAPQFAQPIFSATLSLIASDEIYRPQAICVQLSPWSKRKKLILTQLHDSHA